MNRPSDTLIKKLCDRQEAEDKTEREFAASLGIGQATWTLIRNGINKPGLKFIAAVTRLYPDLEPDVMTFLREEPGLMELWAQPVPA